MASAAAPAPAPQPVPPAKAFTVAVQPGMLKVTVGGVTRDFLVKVGSRDINDKEGLERAKKLMEKYLEKGGLGELVKDEATFKNVREITVGPKSVEVVGEKGGKTAAPIKDPLDFTKKLAKYTKAMTTHQEYKKQIEDEAKKKGYSSTVIADAIKQLLNDQAMVDLLYVKGAAKQKVKEGFEGLHSCLQALSPPPKDDAVRLIDPNDQAKLPECLKFLQDFVRDKVK